MSRKKSTFVDATTEHNHVSKHVLNIEKVSMEYRLFFPATGSINKLYSYNLHETQNQMGERLNEMEPNENINDAAAAAFREGQRSGYVQGLGHFVIPGAPPSVRNSLEFHGIVAKNEKNFNNAEYYKDQFETLKCDLLAIRNRMKENEQLLNSLMSKMESHRESRRDAPGDV